MAVTNQGALESRSDVSQFIPRRNWKINSYSVEAVFRVFIYTEVTHLTLIRGGELVVFLSTYRNKYWHAIIFHICA